MQAQAEIQAQQQVPLERDELFCVRDVVENPQTLRYSMMRSLLESCGLMLAQSTNVELSSAELTSLQDVVLLFVGFLVGTGPSQYRLRPYQVKNPLLLVMQHSSCIREVDDADDPVIACGTVGPSCGRGEGT